MTGNKISSDDRVATREPSHSSARVVGKLQWDPALCDTCFTCTRVRALRSCSGDVHVARVVVSLVVHAVLGLTLGLIAHVVVVVFVVEFP